MVTIPKNHESGNYLLQVDSENANVCIELKITNPSVFMHIFSIYIFMRSMNMFGFHIVKQITSNF